MSLHLDRVLEVFTVPVFLPLDNLMLIVCDIVYNFKLYTGEA